MGISHDVVDIKGFFLYVEDEVHLATLYAAIPDTAEDAIYEYGEENLNNYLPQLREAIAELNVKGLTISPVDCVTGGDGDAIGWENYASEWSYDPTQEEVGKLKAILEKFHYDPQTIDENRFVQVC